MTRATASARVRSARCDSTSVDMNRDSVRSTRPEHRSSAATSRSPVGAVGAGHRAPGRTRSRVIAQHRHDAAAGPSRVGQRPAERLSRQTMITRAPPDCIPASSRVRDIVQLAGGRAGPLTRRSRRPPARAGRHRVQCRRAPRRAAGLGRERRLTSGDVARTPRGSLRTLTWWPSSDGGPAETDLPLSLQAGPPGGAEGRGSCRAAERTGRCVPRQPTVNRPALGRPRLRGASEPVATRAQGPEAVPTSDAAGRIVQHDRLERPRSPQGSARGPPRDLEEAVRERKAETTGAPAGVNRSAFSARTSRTCRTRFASGRRARVVRRSTWARTRRLAAGPPTRRRTDQRGQVDRAGRSEVLGAQRASREGR